MAYRKKSYSRGRSRSSKSYSGRRYSGGRSGGYRSRRSSGGSRGMRTGGVHTVRVVIDQGSTMGLGGGLIANRAAQTPGKGKSGPQF